MTTPIIIVLITSITSLIVSLLSVFLNNRNKYKYFHLTAIQKEKTKALDLKIKALDEMSIQIQRIKDFLQMVDFSVEESMSTKSAIKMIAQLRNEITDTFEICQANLSDVSFDAAHKAKNLSYAIEATLNKISKGNDYISSIDQVDLKLMKDYRAQLSEFQNSIRDSKIEAINQKMQ